MTSNVHMKSPMAVFRHNYPDPFLDIASTRLPKSQKKLLELCYLFSTTHPQIAPIVKKLAKYPITKIIVESKGSLKGIEEKWKSILEKDLSIYEIMEGVGLDFLGYGNAFIIIHKPFIRFYKCKSCGTDTVAGKLKYYITNKAVVGKCPHCKRDQAQFAPRDENVRGSSDGVRVVRLNPMDMYIKRNELTGQKFFYYSIPTNIKKALSNKSKPDRDIIDNTPWVFIQATLEKKKIRFPSSKILHLTEPSPSGRNMEWGMPIIMPALKEAYLNQIYKKADESAANERVLPARFVYPQATTNDPLRSISLKKWSTFMANTLRNWRYDKNAVMPVPFPVGVANLGGDAQAYNTLPMRQQAVREIIGATGVPEGFLSEGMTWTGASVQLRMLENSIMGYLRSIDALLDFIMTETASVVEIPACNVKLKPFSKSDDVQRQQIMIQMAQLEKVSWGEVLSHFDLDFKEQMNRVMAEQVDLKRVSIEKAIASAEAMLQSADVQVESQQRQTDYSTLRSEVTNSNSLTSMTLQSNGANHDQNKATLEQQNQEQQKKEQEQNDLNIRQQKAKILLDESKANRQKAQYQKDMTRADINRQVTYDMASDSPEEMLHQLREKVKSPEALASKLMMIEPSMRQPVFKLLRKQDPALAVRVAMALSPQKDPQRIVGANMRPMPEQKPPRRDGGS